MFYNCDGWVGTKPKRSTCFDKWVTVEKNIL